MLARLTVTQEHHGKLGFHLRSEHRGKPEDRTRGERGGLCWLYCCVPLGGSLNLSELVTSAANDRLHLRISAQVHIIVDTL